VKRKNKPVLINPRFFHIQRQEVLSRLVQKRADFSDEEDEEEFSGSGILAVLSERNILISAGAILISTCSIAVLEPCLPLWLMETIHPQVLF